MPLAAALALTAGLFHVFNHSRLQEPAVLRRRRRAQCHRRARHGASRRAHPPHAADRLRVPDRLRGDLGAAAAQRLRLRMADLPGHSAQPASAVLGAEIHGAGGRRAAGAVGGAGGGLFRQGLRRQLPRPPAHARRRAGAGDRQLFARRHVLAGRAVPGRRHRCRAFSSTRWRRLPMRWSAPACRIRSGLAWLSIVPIAESRSSYNGLLVFLFIVLSGGLAAFAIHRLASDRLRRATGLGLRLSRSEPGDAIHRVQFRAADPARLRHAGVPRPRNRRDAAARLAGAGAADGRYPRPDLGFRSTRRSRGLVGFAADRLNVLQFLTIRSYLSLVFAALVLLLLVLAIWP